MKKLTKTEKAEIGVQVSIAERALSEALRVYKGQPREGVALDGLKRIERVVQDVEAWRASGWTK